MPHEVTRFSLYSFSLSVVAPSSLDLHGPTEAKTGEIITYTCSTANSNPPAVIQWVVGNSTRLAEHTYTVTSPAGGWITHSNISVSLGPNDRSKMVVCNAVNSELNDVKSESRMLSVIYPPGPPQLQGLEDGEVLTAGVLKRVTCTSIAGNPLASIRWFVGEREIRDDSVYYTTKDNYASSTLELVPQPAFNTKTLRCEAANAATPDALTASARLAVRFVPKYLKIAMNPETPRSGDNVTLSCEADSSNPASAISWWAGGERIEGAEEMVLEGDHGGYITQSYLHIPLTPGHHNADITCEAVSDGQRVMDTFTMTVARKHFCKYYEKGAQFPRLAMSA